MPFHVYNRRSHGTLTYMYGFIIWFKTDINILESNKGHLCKIPCYRETMTTGCSVNWGCKLRVTKSFYPMSEEPVEWFGITGITQHSLLPHWLNWDQDKLFGNPIEGALMLVKKVYSL